MENPLRPATGPGLDDPGMIGSDGKSQIAPSEQPFVAPLEEAGSDLRPGKVGQKDFGTIWRRIPPYLPDK